MNRAMKLPQDKAPTECTLASVLTKEPDWEVVPANVRRLLKTCLQKDPKQRLQAVGDWRLLLADVQQSS